MHAITVKIEYESNHKPEYQQDRMVNLILQHHKLCQSENNSNTILTSANILYVMCEELGNTRFMNPRALGSDRV